MCGARLRDHNIHPQMPTVNAATAKVTSDNRNVESRSMEGCQGTETPRSATSRAAGASVRIGRKKSNAQAAQT